MIGHARASMEGHSPTILCVDDDLDLLGVMLEFFTLQGFQVLTAANGLEALIQVRRRPPHAVLLDLEMPRLGGLDTVRRINQFDPKITIVVISGLPDLLESARAAGLNVGGVFAKPLDLAAISATLSRAGITPGKPAVGPLSGKIRSLIRKRVLVVDNDREIREGLASYLQGKGFEALRAAGGEEALRRLPEFRPHIVLLDISMPGLSGIETLRRIKALPTATSVVMLCRQRDEEAARKALALGASDYLRKPVDVASLDAVLETHLLLGQLNSE